jgi:hypothetical protein
LATSESDAVGEESVELRSGDGGVGEIQKEASVGCTGEHLALTGGGGGDDGETGVEVLENFVRDGEVATENVRLFQSETDVVAGDQRGQGVRRNERKKRNGGAVRGSERLE